MIEPTCQCRDSNQEGPIRPPGEDEHDPSGLHYRYCPLYALAPKARRAGKTTDTAMRWALVRFIVDLKMQEAEDALNASAENGWLMRDQSGMFTDVIELLYGLATGEIDAAAYLESERQASLGEVQ